LEEHLEEIMNAECPMEQAKIIKLGSS
jgi:hypothetical protein